MQSKPIQKLSLDMYMSTPSRKSFNNFGSDLKATCAASNNVKQIIDSNICVMRSTKTNTLTNETMNLNNTTQDDKVLYTLSKDVCNSTSLDGNDVYTLTNENNRNGNKRRVFLSIRFKNIVVTKTVHSDPIFPLEFDLKYKVWNSNLESNVNTSFPF